MAFSAYLDLRAIFPADPAAGREAVVEEATVLAMGNPWIDVPGVPKPLLRIHSQCLTGDAFHSLRCDCRAQLEIALSLISEAGRGIIIYELQEGRGIGLMNKLRAYELARTRGRTRSRPMSNSGSRAICAVICWPGGDLRHLGITAVRLLSNNPGKVKAVEDAGVVVTDRVPCVAAPIENREAYLRTKRDKMGHLFDRV